MASKKKMPSKKGKGLDVIIAVAPSGKGKSKMPPMKGGGKCPDCGGKMKNGKCPDCGYTE